MAGKMGNDTALCVCVSVCVCVCMCVCARTHVYVYTCVYMCTWVYVYTCTHGRLCTCACTCVDLCVYVYMCVCVHVCGGVYECVWQGGEVGQGPSWLNPTFCLPVLSTHTLTHSHLKKQTPAHVLGPLIITPRAPPQDPGFTLAWGSHPCCPNEACSGLKSVPPQFMITQNRSV